MRPFAARLAVAVERHGPLCVGVDPHPGLLEAWGLPADAAGLERFALRCVDALAGEVGLLKPQSAFFEAHGATGIAVLERLLGACREAGVLTLLDVKRGDVGSTMAGYAAAYLCEGAPLAADAVTLSPYLGVAALTPALDAAAASGRGVFLLARTSNPEGAAVQDAVHRGRSVAQAVVDAAAARNAAAGGGGRFGPVGVVVGATRSHGLDLSALGGPVLAPGLGAQGVMPEDLPAVFGPVLPDVLPVAAREVLRHGPDPAALRTAARRLRHALAAATGAPR